MTAKDVVIVALLFFISGLGGLMIYASSEYREVIDQLEDERATVKKQSKRIVELQNIIKEDDVLLDHFTHKTWDRDCSYELMAGILLADGSVKSSVVQRCD